MHNQKQRLIRNNTNIDDRVRTAADDERMLEDGYTEVKLC